MSVEGIRWGCSQVPLVEMQSEGGSLGFLALGLRIPPLLRVLVLIRVELDATTLPCHPQHIDTALAAPHTHLESGSYR